MAADQTAEKHQRLWVDGCFDGTHYGHANAIRQAKELGGTLVVGVHSDEAIRINKGPPLMNEQERYAAVRACRWVDEVVEDAPYTTQVEVLRAHNIDFAVHGDDPSYAADGSDCYALVKAAGMYKEVKRTQGVSTTDLISRMLACIDAMDAKAEGVHTAAAKASVAALTSRFTKGSDFIATSTKIAQFSPRRVPGPDDRVVYIDGAWDCLHAGHIGALKAARALGTFLYVGVYDDETVNKYKGFNLPLTTLQERVLSLLSCRYVDDVVIGSPLFLDATFLDALKISVVANGGMPDQPAKEAEGDPYAVARERGIFQLVQSDSPLTTSMLLDRVRENRAMYTERNAKKQKKEMLLSGTKPVGQE
eukprot:a343318_194.p2 GENE.a343318_194~~a343318_194.p2  ORF type:complete len:371 (-),score=171.34 a343318_194:22-1110(-)